MSSKYDRLAAEATPRPWAVVPVKDDDVQVVISSTEHVLHISIPTAVTLEGIWNNPEENAALIVALVNAAPDIAALWKAADDYQHHQHMIPSDFDGDWWEHGAFLRGEMYVAHNALRPLFGKEQS